MSLSCFFYNDSTFHDSSSILFVRVKCPDDSDNSNNANVCNRDNDDKLPDLWNRKTEYVYGISDSLYDVNQVTKCKNGNPIADCYGIIARTDSCILALADGVNWGKKTYIYIYRVFQKLRGIGIFYIEHTGCFKSCAT